MLKEHASTSRNETSATSDDVLESDTFWQLIEKFLLRSSIDAQARNQHNLALSAMCRGRALPCLPRNIKAGKGNKQDNKENGTVSSPNKEPNSLNANKSCETIKHTETLDQPDENLSHNPTKTQSECFTNNLDIVCVTDSKIPASERLWRYAMKHSKKKADTNEVNKLEFKPQVRSNQAIYNALKQRLDKALSEKEGRNVKNQKKTAKKIRNTKVPKTCNSLETNYGQGIDESISHTTTPDSSSTPLRVESGDKIHPLHKRRSSHGVAHEIRRRSMMNNSAADLGIKVCPSRHERMEGNQALYDCVLKKRLSCGNQLETLNKEILYKKHNPRSITTREMKKKYAELKSEYLKLCYQECSLRHQMAILHAEIYMMQNKGYHKTPATIKTINLDSNSANIRPEFDYSDAHSKVHRNDSSDILLFPRLKAPKPLLGNQLRNPYEKSKECKERGGSDSDSTGTEFEEPIGTPLPYIMDRFPTHGVCSIYSLCPQLAPLPKRTPIMTIEAKLSRDNIAEMAHRLPKLSTINLLKAAQRN